LGSPQRCGLFLLGFTLTNQFSLGSDFRKSLKAIEKLKQKLIKIESLPGLIMGFCLFATLSFRAEYILQSIIICKKNITFIRIIEQKTAVIDPKLFDAKT
jgi:hypothetical protein